MKKRKKKKFKRVAGGSGLYMRRWGWIMTLVASEILRGAVIGCTFGVDVLAGFLPWCLDGMALCRACLAGGPERFRLDTIVPEGLQ